MRKKYLEAWVRVQVFDEETLTEEYGDKTEHGTFIEGGGGDGGVTDGEEDWF